MGLWLVHSQAQTLTPAPTSVPAFVQKVRSVQAVAAEGTSFPDMPMASSIHLPDEWSSSRPGFSGTVWYRATLPQPPPTPDGDLLALYISRVCSHLEIYFNGQLVHSGVQVGNWAHGWVRQATTGGTAAAVAATRVPSHECNHPQLISLPQALWRSGDNTLDLKVRSYALNESGSRQRAGALSTLRIGPQSLLAPQHRMRTALQVVAPQALSATLLLMGGFMFVLGFVNRRESHLAYFGALSVGWALFNSRLWWNELPISHARAEFLLCALMGFITWAAVQFLLRYGGLRLRWVDKWLPLQCAMLAISLFAAGPARLNAVVNFWTLVLTLQVAAAAALYLRQQWPSKSAWLMGGLLATVALAGLLEAAVQWAHAPLLLTHISRLVLPLILVLMGLRLVQQQGHALNTAEEVRDQLEQRVRESAAEIERNFSQMAELRVEQVTERERKRIAADLHDDLGAKLLTIVHTSESERISTLAREALEEMRLSVRGLTGKPVRLADALGDWRAEVVSRLAQAGIDGEWTAPEDLPQTLSARAYVQTTRILREATSNVIKHSGASHCSISASLNDGDFQLVVQDDGDGISHEVEGRLDRGHGLAGMKNRAKQLQGQCLVESGPGFGTVIRLTLPLTGATEGA